MTKDGKHLSIFSTQIASLWSVCSNLSSDMMSLFLSVSLSLSLLFSLSLTCHPIFLSVPVLSLFRTAHICSQMSPVSMRIVAAVSPTATPGEGGCWVTVFTIGRRNKKKCVEKACSLCLGHNLSYKTKWINFLEAVGNFCRAHFSALNRKRSIKLN